MSAAGLFRLACAEVTLCCSVVSIHNAVNERAWREVLAWEALHDRDVPPRLVRFTGRPQDFSPKARLLNLLGYKLPFDRHDWVVDRDGQHVRYIIDFYSAQPGTGKAVGMYLDVRPALDSPTALLDRLRMQCRFMLSGESRADSFFDARPPSPSPKHA